jgi:ribonucleoside-diphosphate reductase alpha chain
MLSMLFETGHPWITFKDACNVRSPQQHVGVVHSSNLCTEITLNTSDTETAVCNLGSVNLLRHLTDDGQIDHAKLRKTITTRCACSTTSSTSTTTRSRRRVTPTCATGRWAWA